MTLAYPAPASETTEAIACDAFLDAMSDSDLSLKVREKKPKSLNETFTTAVWMETYKKSFRLQRRRRRYVESLGVRYGLPGKMTHQPISPPTSKTSGKHKRKWLHN